MDHYELIAAKREPILLRAARFGNPTIPAQGNHTACPRAPIIRHFSLPKDPGGQRIPWQETMPILPEFIDSHSLRKTPRGK